MDKFPRDKQNELLLFLYEKAPYPITDDEYESIVAKFGSEDSLYLNLWYLYRHRLIENFYIANSTDQIISPSDNIIVKRIHITEKGIDFIRDDGGLSAILNVTTIKIHNETLEKLEQIIEKSDLTAEEKLSYLNRLKDLPVEATKHLVLKLLDLGLSRVPDVIQLIASHFH